MSNVTRQEKFVGKLVVVSILTALAALAVAIAFAFNSNALEQPENAGEAVGEAFGIMILVVFAVIASAVGGLLTIPSIVISFVKLVKVQKIKVAGIIIGVLNISLLLACIMRIVLLVIGVM